MDKNDFYEHIKQSFFVDLTADFENFKSMILSAFPIFGELEIDIKNNEDETKTVHFFDVDETQFATGPDWVNEVDTRMTSRVFTLRLNQNNMITAVDHSYTIFSPENKEQVLLLSSFIGKTINFE